MKKAAVLLAPGFEEGEALFVIDILRRAGITCDAVSTDGTPTVTGSHNITVVPDKALDAAIYEYDMLILPGGMPGSENLKNNTSVVEAVKAFDRNPDQYVAAICAAPMVLAEAGITTGRRLTSFPGEKFDRMFSDADYLQDLVVIDDSGHLITSRGPATTMTFAYTLVDLLGGDSAPLKEGMLYNLLMK